MTSADTGLTPVARALLSVADKTGIVGLARALRATGVELLSTDGTFRLLQSEGIEATEVSRHTGFPEIMDGRVKTLHPKIHGGILARRGRDDAVLAAHGIAPIDLVVLNLYPFEQTVARPDCRFADAIENIDIGGPALLRAAAKNHAHVAVVVEPGDYAALTAALHAGGTSAAQRLAWSAKAYALTARYDAAIAAYLSRAAAPPEQRNEFPPVLGLQLQKRQDLRYGENPHQQAAFYVERDAPAGTLGAARQLQGKALSYNNIADADAALECVKSFVEPACVIVKHANPCGVAVSLEGIGAAYELAFQTDPTSAFGGIIAFNRALDAETAQRIVGRQFVEVIVAPGLGDAARAALAARQNVRVLESGAWPQQRAASWDYKRVGGGLLVQHSDAGMIGTQDLRVVSRRAPTPAEIDDLIFAWKVAKFVKSNAIVYAKERRTIGIGAGQMSRVYSARIAGIKASDEKLEVRGSVMASDAFFPFRDGIDAAAAAGIRAAAPCRFLVFHAQLALADAAC